MALRFCDYSSGMFDGEVPQETGLRDHSGPEVADDANGSSATVERAAPPIVLLHGLMGRGRTWRRQVPWLRRYGRVFTYDAAFHTGEIGRAHV